jgi:glycerate kinase
MGPAGMGHVLVAPDKFKGSASAAEVAAHLAAGLRTAGRAAVELPVADGGEGTLDAAVAAGFRRVPVTVTGPAGRPVRSAIAIRHGTAVVELAAASGLALLPAGPDPLRATSRGTGELVLAALDAGATTVVLGVGGSAGTDGGAGMLAALGARLLDGDGAALPDGGGALARLARVDLVRLDRRLADVRVVLASDVDNPLLGPSGAAAGYGPQKGASPADVAVLDAALARWAALVDPAAAVRPGAGAAGGVGFAALAVLGAEPRPGIEVVLGLVGFADRVAGAALVVTGEGSLDEQTLHGKAPAGVAVAARGAGVPVVAVCGRSLIRPDQAAGAGIAAVYALTDLEPDVARCIAHPGPLLRAVGRRLAEHGSLSAPRDRQAATRP